MDCILVHGLRQRRLYHSGGWFERMTDAITGRWPVLTASPETQCAEHGLGIAGRPYYFFALRTDENFGLVVFLLSEIEGVDWPPDARGATPFDSGGLWIDKIATDPPLDQRGRRGFFEAHDVPLTAWRPAFETYIRKSYETIADYVRGSPAGGTLPQTSGPAIVMGQPNDPRAWTWEVRVPHQLVARHLALRAVCLSEANHSRYLDWLWDDQTPLATSERRDIEKRIHEHMIVPSPGLSEADRAAEWLLAEVA